VNDPKIFMKHLRVIHGYLRYAVGKTTLISLNDFR